MSPAELNHFLKTFRALSTEDKQVVLAALANDVSVPSIAECSGLASVPTREPSTLSEVEFDAQLNALTHHGPSLPPAFSRADVYADHD